MRDEIKLACQFNFFLFYRNVSPPHVGLHQAKFTLETNSPNKCDFFFLLYLYKPANLYTFNLIFQCICYVAPEELEMSGETYHDRIKKN